MLDQATALRSMFQERGSVRGGRGVYTIAVTSGKGGVGKTSIAVNLALLLSRAGRQVRLVDADFGLSNAEVMLGVKPGFGLVDVLHGRASLQSAWLDVAPGVCLLSTGSGVAEMADLDGAAGREVVAGVVESARDGDIVIIDTAPGIDRTVMSLVDSADEVLVVTTPEPTAMTDTYAAIKVISSGCPDAQVTLVANCCANPSQASAIASGLRSICGRFLGRSFERHEYLPCDAEVPRAVQTQVPLVVRSPYSPAASWLRKIAIKLDCRARTNAASRAAEMVEV